MHLEIRKKLIFFVKPLSTLVLLLPLLSMAFIDHSASAKGLAIVRDYEIGNTIRAYSAPFEVAGLDLNSIRIRLVKDNSLNAFVAGGQNIFINTGLPVPPDNAGQIIGVLGIKELVIFQAGIYRVFMQCLKMHRPQSILAMDGTAAAVAAGSTERVTGALIGGQALGQRALFKYTRVWNRLQISCKFFERTGQSFGGIIEFLQILQKQSAIYAGSKDPYYANTHPCRKIEYPLGNHVKKSRFSRVPTSKQFTVSASAWQNKWLCGHPHRTLNYYSAEDKRIEARYARAYAFMKLHDVKNALNIAD